MNVTAVVVNWNGFENTKRCVESLRDVDVVVVDNGSTDGSAERIAAELPDVELIRSDRNRGFAGGANLGIRRALEGGAEYVWHLNNDTQVEPGTLSALVATAEGDPFVGIVGGALSNEWGGGRVSISTGVTKPATGPGDRIDYITGACMLVRRAVFEEVGLFDELFFFYFEDADFCLRARAAGWRLAVAADARVTHTGGATVGEAADRLQVQSSGRFIGKHAGARAVVGVPLRLAGIALNRARRGQVHAVPDLSRELVRGALAGRRARTGRRWM